MQGPHLNDCATHRKNDQAWHAWGCSGYGAARPRREARRSCVAGHVRRRHGSSGDEEGFNRVGRNRLRVARLVDLTGSAAPVVLDRPLHGPADEAYELAFRPTRDELAVTASTARSDCGTSPYSSEPAAIGTRRRRRPANRGDHGGRPPPGDRRPQRNHPPVAHRTRRGGRADLHHRRASVKHRRW